MLEVEPMCPYGHQKWPKWSGEYRMSFLSYLGDISYVVFVTKKVKVAHTRIPIVYASGADSGSWQLACKRRES